MKNEILSIIKVGSIYTATVIGAGFASGREMTEFFLSYGEKGFYGIVTAGILFALVGFFVLDRVYTERIRNYDELLFPMTGWFLGWVVEIVGILFMISVFCVMVAGTSNIVSDVLGIRTELAVLVTCMAVSLVLLADIRGLVSLGAFITPVLIAGMILTGLYIIIFRDNRVFSFESALIPLTRNWFASSIIYVSYNNILSVVVLSSMLPYLKSRRVARAGGLLGGGLLCVVALIISLALYLFLPDSLSGNFPIINIISRHNGWLTVFYTFVLWLAMFFTAITSGFCVIERIGAKLSANRKFTINRKITSLLVCAAAVPLSGLGFSTLIAGIYPVFGYMGLFLLIMIIISGIKSIIQVKN